MEVQKYLDRIGFQGSVEISLACLTKLQRFHELNGLFAWLLRSLGFEVKMVSANYYDPDKGKFKGEFDHMTLVVRLAGQDYLTDVGFGNIHQPYDPIRMTEAASHLQESG